MMKNHHALKNSVKLISKLHGDLYFELACSAISRFSVNRSERARRVFSNARHQFHTRRQVRHCRSIGECRPGCCCGGAISRLRVIIFVKKRISRPVQPNSVAALNRTIHTMNAGCTPRANSVALPTMIPRPQDRYAASTMLGTPASAGHHHGALMVGSVKLAPQRLQYFSSTDISLPQEDNT